MAQRWKYNGKEFDESLDINTYDFGWRSYDPAIARWMNIDPLAGKRYGLTPYNYVQNSPMFRFDPDGLTDFTLNKKTGELTQIGEENDEPDRILKTYTSGKKKGQIKYNKEGEAKVAINDIEKGILSDGMNFKENSYAFEVGGEGQPSEKGVESFALKLSSYIGREVGGAYFSTGDSDNTTHISIGAYKENKSRKTNRHGIGAFRQFVSTVEEFTSSLRGYYHTHPNDGAGDTDRLAPGPTDLDTRDSKLKHNPSLRFFILTHPEYGREYPRKIEYTTGFEYRRKR